ncbi:MAG: 3-oxoacyl-ACP synthase [Bacteroidia bacterium]|nr:3-oxoacyl-ACP synthase [Bacteroidia bacterium]
MNQKSLLYKSQLVALIKTALLNRMAEADASIVSAKEARDGDTKSSAGDKYETGREMMQMEIDKAAMQLHSAQKLLHELEKIDLTKSGPDVNSGSLVTTNKEVFFIAIGFGKIQFEGEEIFVISPASPLGSNLLHMQAGTTFSFQGIDRLILSVF